MQPISMKKILALWYRYDSVTQRQQSVTLGLRVWVQPAKPASPIRLLRDQLLNVYVFSAHNIFTTFCAPFHNRISYFKILAMPYVYVLCPLLTRIQRSHTFPVVWK